MFPENSLAPRSDWVIRTFCLKIANYYATGGFVAVVAGFLSILILTGMGALVGVAGALDTFWLVVVVVVVVGVAATVRCVIAGGLLVRLHPTCLIVPNRLDSPLICPAPPNSCISCDCDMLLNSACRSWSGRSSEDCTALDGLFSSSLMRLQLSSSLSVLESCVSAA